MAQIQSVNQAEAEVWYVHVQNGFATTLTTGYLACYEGRVLSSQGLWVTQPVTSATALFAGVAAADIATEGYGRLVAHGPAPTYISTVVGDTMPVGRILGPVTASWAGQSVGLSFAFGPLICLSQTNSNQLTNVTCYVRAMM